MEAYVRTIPESEKQEGVWTMPLLRGSGGHLMNPVSAHEEADAIEGRNLARAHADS